MKRLCFYLVTVTIFCLLVSPAFGATIYNNLTPTNAMGIATRPDVPGGPFEIEGADDFFLTAQTLINSASFVGVIVPGPTGGSSTITDVVAEMYRIFPADSNTTRTPNVLTRTNSPSDDDFASKSSDAGQLTFTFSVLNPTFTMLNTVQPGGIHPFPNQTTGGNGALTGAEVQINATFLSPFNLVDGHLFFVPQVELSNGATFYWLSASRGPISGPGTTPFPATITDLQSWTRDAALDPDWSRVGTDIVGGTTPPTFNTAFSLDGTVIPEPPAGSLVLIALALIGAGSITSKRKAPR